MCRYEILAVVIRVIMSSTPLCAYDDHSRDQKDRDISTLIHVCSSLVYAEKGRPVELLDCDALMKLLKTILPVGATRSAGRPSGPSRGSGTSESGRSGRSSILSEDGLYEETSASRPSMQYSSRFVYDNPIPTGYFNAYAGQEIARDGEDGYDRPSSRTTSWTAEADAEYRAATYSAEFAARSRPPSVACSMPETRRFDQMPPDARHTHSGPGSVQSGAGVDCSSANDALNMYLQATEPTSASPDEEDGETEFRTMILAELKELKETRDQQVAFLHAGLDDRIGNIELGHAELYQRVEVCESKMDQMNDKILSCHTAAASACEYAHDVRKDMTTFNLEHVARFERIEAQAANAFQHSHRHGQAVYDFMNTQQEYNVETSMYNVETSMYKVETSSKLTNLQEEYAALRLLVQGLSDGQGPRSPPETYDAHQEQPGHVEGTAAAVNIHWSNASSEASAAGAQQAQQGGFRAFTNTVWNKITAKPPHVPGLKQILGTAQPDPTVLLAEAQEASVAASRLKARLNGCKAPGS